MFQKSEEQSEFLSLEAFTVQERERKRMAAELDEGIGQNLAAIKFRVENLLQQVKGTRVETSSEILHSIVLLVQEAMGEIKKFEMHLRREVPPR